MNYLKNLSFIIMVLLFYGCSLTEEEMLEYTVPMYGGRLKSFPELNNQAPSDYYSKASAEMGFDEIFRENQLQEAMKYFNLAWRFNPDNYEVYWGFGIIAGKKAQSGKREIRVEFYLKESVKMLEKAYLLATSKEKSAIAMDLANAYTGLGHYYQTLEENKENKLLAESYLQKSEKICEDLAEKQPENGRSYFLWAASLFYQGKLKEAQEKTVLSQKYKFNVPPEFLKDLKMMPSY